MTTISYQIPGAINVKLEIYSLLGQKILTLVDKEHEPGHHTITWNGRDHLGKAVASGVYIYRLPLAGSWIPGNWL